MAEIDPRILQAKVATEKKLLNLPGVTGVAVGYKEVGGRSTNTVAIRVFVEKKREVPASETIAKTIEGFPTDVAQRKFGLHALAKRALELVPLEDTKEYPVLKGGISVGARRLVEGMAYGGTLGALVTDKSSGKPMILSNYHVLCVDKAWSDGDAIVQPSLLDRSAGPPSQAAILKRGIVNERVDCAVAEVSGRGIDWEIIDIGAISGAKTSTLGQTVRKRGRTTGLTYGVVTDVELTTQPIDYGDGIGRIQLINQIGIDPDRARNMKFGDDGDSGSVIVNDGGEAVGLYCGGGLDDPDNPKTFFSFANPITAVLAALDVTIGPPPDQPGEPRQSCHSGGAFLVPFPPFPLPPSSPFLIPYPQRS